MELPDGNSWIDNPLLSQEEVQHPHALYATDLPPLAQSAEQAQSNLFDQPFHQSVVGNFVGDATGLQHSGEFQHQQQFPQAQGVAAEQLQHPGTKSANERRVHKADREKLRRDRLNEQFTELASALDPDRPKNDKATILSDSVQELNELRAEVKRLKAEHAALLDESRDLTQEKSELREEKALLKSETEQLQAQLQQRLRLSLSWTPMDPSLMMTAAAFPYPLPVPAPLPGPPPPDSSSQSQAQTQAINSSNRSNQVPTPMLPPSPFLPPPGAFAVHPYAAMFAHRPPGANLPFFPYFHPPPGLVPGSNSSVERPFAQYPTPMRSVPHSEGEPPSKTGVPFPNQVTTTTTTTTVAPTATEPTCGADEPSDACQVSAENTQKEGPSSPANQSFGSKSPSHSLGDSPEITRDSPAVA